MERGEVMRGWREREVMEREGGDGERGGGGERGGDGEREVIVRGGDGRGGGDEREVMEREGEVMERGQERFSEQSKCGTYIDSG